MLTQEKEYVQKKKGEERGSNVAYLTNLQAIIASELVSLLLGETAPNPSKHSRRSP